MGVYLKLVARSLEKNRIAKYALIGNTCFGVLLRGLGDLIQQTIETKAPKAKEKEADSAIPDQSCLLKSTAFQTQKYDWTRTRMRIALLFSAG